ncbi:ankyrin repeat-containing protein ITN1-like isoform X2 [Phaseolus vulgaris]|uniref:ankyrin repeat-containing protein ITN1-like isoform X2 n=1 Tax=Phaseolus vulgaris TaxID=3885 RepID=UPI0035CA467C
MMNPDVEVSDDSNIEIIISRDYLSYEQTDPPVATSHAVTPISDIYRCALRGDWSEMEAIVRNDPDSVRIKLTETGDTALHVAAGAGNTNFVKELTNLMKTEEQLIPNSEGMLAVHLAALSRHHTIVKHFCSYRLLHGMAYKDVEKLFFMTIDNDMFDLASEIIGEYPRLSTARNEEELTALHMLARKPSEVLRVNKGRGIALLERIWSEVERLEIEDLFAFITRPSVLLSDAIKSESYHHEVINTFLEMVMNIDPRDAWIPYGPKLKERSPNGRNLLHLLFLHRRYQIFNEIFIKFLSNRIENLLLVGDDEGNNVLHLAALFPIQFQSFSGLSPYIQMQREVAWFKKAQESVPRELRSVKNEKGMTPIDVFYDEHNQLSKDIKETAKGIADSGMIVATLVATVAFAAALTVPGDKNNTWFIVFIFTNAVALFTSSASILSFLSNFTSSRFAQSEFVISLHPSLTFGRVLLIISVAAMVLAFIAASFLVFAHTTKWVSYIVAPLGVFALLLFLLFQSKFCDDHFWSRYYRPKLE